MRRVRVDRVKEAVKRLCMDIAVSGSKDISRMYRDGLSLEESEIGREIIGEYLENLEVARSLNIPLCQDTGMAVVFVELGQEVVFEGGYLYDAIEKGVEEGYREGYLRNSVVDPITREKLPGYNTPPVVHVDLVPGDKVKISVMAKGFGSENMSALKMLPPSAGIEGVKDFVVSVVERAGANPCPPVVVGVGIGGTMEKAAILSKKALLRPYGVRNPREDIGKLEEELIDRINALGIGPQGFGGRVTCFDVRVEVYPTHIASIPVAVNIQCHAVRHGEVVI